MKKSWFAKSVALSLATVLAAATLGVMPARAEEENYDPFADEKQVTVEIADSSEAASTDAAEGASLVSVEPVTADVEDTEEGLYEAGVDLTNYKTISIGQEVTGSIVDKNSCYAYQITLPESGTLTTTVKLENLSQMAWEIYDVSGKKIVGELPKWESTLRRATRTYTCDLTSGVYYLVCYEKWTNGNYGDFSMNTEFVSAGETYPEGQGGNNNAADTAVEIQPAASVTGQVAVNDDADAYKFTLSKSGTWNIKLTAKEEYLGYTLTDANGNKIWDGRSYWNSATKQGVTNQDLNLIAGTYYLILSKYYKVTGNYTFETSFTDVGESFVDAQGATHDSLDTASPINLDQEYTGHIADNCSSDFFKITLDRQQIIVVKSKSRLQGLHFKLYNSDGVQEELNKTSYWDNTTKVNSLVEYVTLGAGVHYFQVSRTYYNGPYTFSLNSYFRDVTDTKSWYYEPIKWAVEKDITAGMGDNRFGINNTCTRAQVMTFLYKAAGSPSVDSLPNTFSDVPNGSWYRNAVVWAVNQGITSGVGGGKFGPAQPCTRSQVVTFLYKASGSTSQYSSTKFRDVEKGKWYFNPIVWAVNKGITSGLNNEEFGVFAPCTRAQVMTFIYKQYR